MEDNSINSCLSDDDIAAVVDGVDPTMHVGAIAHLSECADCRSRLAAVASLLDDRVVSAEIEALEGKNDVIARNRLSLSSIGGIGALAAASLAIVLLGPARMRSTSNSTAAAPVEMRREGTMTTTAPPRVLSSAALNVEDSLRWTTVPGADLYRVQIWNREGTVVWSTDTRDTTLSLPLEMTKSGGSYLWEVKARTGWDRWVTSDFVELTIRSQSPRLKGWSR